MKDETKPKIDEFHCHEVADRCHIICSIIDDFLLTHPLVLQNPELESYLINSQSLIVDVIQKVSDVEKYLTK